MKISSKKSKLTYRFTFQIGLILSLLVNIMIFKADIKSSKEDDEVRVQLREEIFIEEIIQTKQELRAPAPPRPSVPVEVPNDEIIEDEIIEIDAEIDLGTSLEIPLPPRPEEKNDEVEDEIFVVVENPPVLIGGIESVQRIIKYPNLAMEAGIEGRVIVQFVIDVNGNVKNPFVVRGIGGGCDEEAIRAVSQAKFRPGLQRGKPVQVRYTLPITFKLKQANNS